jgi:SAM-dependent methyltransferase
MGRAFGRYQRARAMDTGELLRRLATKVRHMVGYRATARRLAFALDRHSRALYDGPYVERPEAGPVNLNVKLERLRRGGPFEPYEIALVNRAATTLLQPQHRRILEIGSGTGMFAAAAARAAGRHITASELNAPARLWAAANRAAPNIDYVAHELGSVTAGQFDLVVAIEVIEHIDRFGPFVMALSQAAPAALITTPNKWCDPFRSVDRTPGYDEHVREWTAGEFLWVLRAFFGRVDLYTIPDRRDQAEQLRNDEQFTPRVARCSDLSCEEPLLALCTEPLFARAGSERPESGR